VSKGENLLVGGQSKKGGGRRRKVSIESAETSSSRPVCDVREAGELVELRGCGGRFGVFA
jgi:hypothetical protein